MGVTVPDLLVVHLLRHGAAVLQLCRDFVYDGCAGVLAVEIHGTAVDQGVCFFGVLGLIHLYLVLLMTTGGWSWQEENG